MQVKEFKDPAATVIKHVSICGTATDKKLVSAYKKAHKADTLSSFGGVIGLNRKVDKDTANQIIKSGFKECIIAPSYSKESLKIFSVKKNMRVLETDLSKDSDYRDIKGTYFGYLVQRRDKLTLDKAKLQVVTKKKPTKRQLDDLSFAWKVVKYVKSNAVVVAKNNAVLELDGDYYDDLSGVIIVEGKTRIRPGAVLRGSGEQGSYIMVVSLNESLENAVQIDNTSDAGIFYVPYGAVLLNQRVKIREATAYKIILQEKAEIEYEIVSGKSSKQQKEQPEEVFSYSIQLGKTQ